MDDIMLPRWAGGAEAEEMRPYIDMHCDTLMQAALAGQADICRMDHAMVDLERLRRGGCMAQFFAIFMPPPDCPDGVLPDDEAYIALLRGILLETVRRRPEAIASAGNREELEANWREGKTSALLTLEDGRAVAGRMENLERFYGLGVRLITLTWNHANCFGWPNAADPAEMGRGLTDFGKDAVVRMGELGMLVDVSHLSDGGFWDVAGLAKKPFVASHSNCRALLPHQRNLTDEMIRTVGESGGVVGLNFAAEFLAKDGGESTADEIARHARHLADCGGVGCVALGSDMDGIAPQIEVDSPEKMGLLFDALLRAGFHEFEVEQIAVGNMLRVIGEVMG